MKFPDNLLFRRLHSFMGALPLGFFLVFHLYENSFALQGQAVYDGRVQSLRGLPYLHVLEVAFIYIPLLYHSLYGLYIWYTGENNYPRYGYARNGLYTLQRVTGLAAFVFVWYHIYDQRLLPYPSYYTVFASLMRPEVLALYFIGVAAASFHLFLGLWNASIKWGIAIGERAQGTLLAVCTAAGLGLVFVGLRALTGFMR